MSKKTKYNIDKDKLGTEVTLNVKGLPRFVVLGYDLPDNVLGWLARNTNLVTINE